MIGGLRPYPDYKESGVSWLGRIPGHWDISPGRAVFAEEQVKNKGLAERRVLSPSYN
jgi:type I restriction enzyme S subunit